MWTPVGWMPSPHPHPTLNPATLRSTAHQEKSRLPRMGLCSLGNGPSTRWKGQLHNGGRVSVLVHTCLNKSLV